MPTGRSNDAILAAMAGGLRVMPAAAGIERGRPVLMMHPDDYKELLARLKSTPDDLMRPDENPLRPEMMRVAMHACADEIERLRAALETAACRFEQLPPCPGASVDPAVGAREVRAALKSPADDHRSFPDAAADGRPTLPMEPELWAAGCDHDTARFAARQLRSQGYYLVRADDLGWDDIRRLTAAN